ncbi:MAG: hypothetical protein IT547_14040 [Hyphomonadaceae bacterium]|jgi:hypothetical protein|nr:hypothetical protein [Hyphomonadaceae bacterium]
MTEQSSAQQQMTLVGRQAKGSWFGRFAFGLVGLLLVTLKLMDFGAAHGWNFLSDFQRHISEVHWDLWRGVGIVILDSFAAAAVISIALTYIIVTNTFNTTTIEASEEFTQAIADIQAKVATFGRQLAANRLADEKILKDLLDYAATQQNATLRRRLNDDDELFRRLVKALSAAVEDVNRSRPQDEKGEAA